MPFQVLLCVVAAARTRPSSGVRLPFNFTDGPACRCVDIIPQTIECLEVDPPVVEALRSGMAGRTHVSATGRVRLQAVVPQPLCGNIRSLSDLAAVFSLAGRGQRLETDTTLSGHRTSAGAGGGAGRGGGTGGGAARGRCDGAHVPDPGACPAEAVSRELWPDTRN